MADIGFRLLGSNDNFRAMIDSSQNMVTKFGGALNLLGVGIGAAGVIGFFKNVVERGGDLQDLSDRLGVGTDALQAFDLAVRQAGGSSEQANQAWDKGRKALDNLAAGTPSVVAQFDKIGLSAASFQGLDLAGSLELIAKGYADNAEKAGAYDAVTDILGAKSAPALLAVINQLGTEGFPALLNALDASGNKIESDTIRQLDALGDSVEAMKGRFISAGATMMGWVLNFGEFLGASVANTLNIFQGLEMSGLENSAIKAKAAVKELVPALAELTKEGAKQIEQEVQKDAAGKAHLDRTVRLNLLKQQQADIEAFLAQGGLEEIERQKFVVGLAETKKLIALDEKALAGDREKHQTRMEAVTAKEIEDKRKLLTVYQQMALLRQDEAGWQAVLNDGAASEEVHRNAEYQLAKTRETLRQIAIIGEKEKLGVMEEETAEIVEQNKKLEIQNQITRKGKGYEQQSDDSLEGVRQRLQDQIEAADRERFGQIVGVGGKSKTFEQSLLEGELFNINKEITERDKIRDYSSRFGEQRARQQFGDTLTDKALRDWTDQQTATTTAVQDIQQRLALLFPKK